MTPRVKKVHGKHDYWSINYLGRLERGCVNVASGRRATVGGGRPATVGHAGIYIYGNPRETQEILREKEAKFMNVQFL